MSLIDHHMAGGRACGAVVDIDLNRFNDLNDRQGHDIGDQVLTAVGKRLASSLREGDIAARLGGDEFVIALAAPMNEESASAITERAVRDGTGVVITSSTP